MIQCTTLNKRGREHKLSYTEKKTVVNEQKKNNGKAH